VNQSSEDDGRPFDLVVVVLTWNMIGVPFHDDGDLSHAKPEHLLWALLFLKVYGDESYMATLCGGSGGAVDEKTFSKMVEGLCSSNCLSSVQCGK